jgi:N-acetylglucosamine kinase-like BadF-type ATPase
MGCAELSPVKGAAPAEGAALLRGAVLAVDGGNSKTDVMLATADGTVLGEARGGPFRPQSAGVENAIDSVAKAVEELRDELGLAPDVPLARHLSAYVAGADLPVEEEALAEAFAARGWTETVDVGNDSFAVLRSGTAQHWGVAVVCGAGMNCVGIAPDGRRVRYPALGAMTGDWGGGLELARYAMWAAVRGEDGRGPHTALAAAIAAHFATPTALDAALGFHLHAVAEERIHELSPLLLEVAAPGDEVALEAVERQAAEVVGWAAATIDRLGLLDREVEVVLGGGVLRTAAPVLMDRITRICAERIPRVSLVIPRKRPVLGAVLLGLDRLGP